MATIVDAKVHYDAETATRLAIASVDVYEPPDVVHQTAITYWGRGVRVWFFNVESTQCVLIANSEELVVCFRGSEARLEDWIVDLDFSLVPGPLGGRVHEGFYDGLAYIWSSLNEQVQLLLRERPRRLIVTGHSLGGALATLAAAQWKAEGTAVDYVYTYGQPRTGDREFARAYNLALRSRSFRIVNHLDVVTRTPPRSVGFRHMGTFIYLDQAGAAHDNILWWRQFLNGWCGAIENILEWCGEGILDHRGGSYLRRLSALAPAAPIESTSIPLRERSTAVRRRRAA